MLVCSLSMHTHQGEATWGHSEKLAICKPESNSTPETDYVGHLILDFCLQNCDKIVV